MNLFSTEIPILDNLTPEVVDTLLIDRTLSMAGVVQNIKWATDEYAEWGDGYRRGDRITRTNLIRDGHCVAIPGAFKRKETLRKRARSKAEVLTPTWVCNMMNNEMEDAWLGVKNLFNTAIFATHEWHTNYNPIPFEQTTCTWQEYLSTNRLEITCGEAPFMVSRYDSITGEYIELQDRIGQLDRKMRVVNENTRTPHDWLKWAEVAFKTIYGYEWQGDNLVVARLNFIQSFIEYYRQRFDRDPDTALQLRFAYIISWNVWQMDGLKFVIPETCGNRVEHEGLFGDLVVKPCKGCQLGAIKGINEHNGVYACVMDWEENKVIEFRSIYNEQVSRKNKNKKSK